MSVWNESAWYSLFVITAVKSIVALGAAWLAAKLLRGRSAAARHLVWTAASAALLALPFLSISLPALRVPVAGSFLTPGTVFETTISASPEAPRSYPRPQPGAAPTAQSRLWHLDWRLTLMLLWACGAAAALAQMFAASAVVWRLRRRTSQLTDPDLPALAQVLGIRHDVAVQVTHRGSMPMTFGLLRPAVFMPADASEWSPGRRRVVLLHELAHVRRGDIATHLLARTALSLYWWNPLAWMAWREFLKERERATDDLVLSTGARASDYAGHLLEIARTMQSPPAMGWAAVAMARTSQLEGRLLAILDSGRNRKPAGRTAALVTALLAVSIVAPLASLKAQDDSRQALPADADATIRTAIAQRDPEMLDKAASVAERLQNYDMAQKLLEASLSIRGEVSGLQSVEYGVGLIRLADLERNRGKTAEAENSYAKAVSVLGDRPEAAPALIHLGTLAWTKKELDQAIHYFERSQAADPAQAGPAMMWMALARQAQKNTEEAESFYKRALAIEGPNSTEAAITLELYAKFLHQQGRGEEETAARRQAADIWKAQGAQAMAVRPVSSPNVYRIGNGVTAPVVLSKVDPAYTEEARLAKYAGTVVVSVEIRPDGLAYNIRTIRGLGLGLDEKAIQAISQWRFKPGTKDGQPVAIMATIEVNFRLR